jgi:sec-independent protein translocase protein TatA
MPFGVHPGFLIILLIIVLIVFGPGKLPELGSAIGRGIREFRRESDKIIDEVKTSTTERESPPPADEVKPRETSPTVSTDTPKAPTEAAKFDPER